ncbi:hypothetical protein BCV70DRAFT_54494 [Testicularia cyperi]|uniref:Uncharacterized protein n=1 Tax=Testicularia cyperi TaxID=1882483 RepID=A0A317XXF3_9BASI|nr:hypothetical protein BCV70DRAFT_54494 [Testicularia cyperi]
MARSKREVQNPGSVESPATGSLVAACTRSHHHSLADVARVSKACEVEKRCLSTATARSTKDDLLARPKQPTALQEARSETSTRANKRVRRGPEFGRVRPDVDPPIPKKPRHWSTTPRTHGTACRSTMRGFFFPGPASSMMSVVSAPGKRSLRVSRHELLSPLTPTFNSTSVTIVSTKVRPAILRRKRSTATEGPEVGKSG